MLTLKRFAALAASYGADFGRWPDKTRNAAAALLARSADARALLDDARTLDGALSGAARPTVYGQHGEAEAALVRLRLGVDLRIAYLSRPAMERKTGSVRGVFDLRWLGLVTGSCLAVAAGLVLGMIDLPSSSPDIMQVMLQPAPIDMLAE